jgi:hypothetical protein
MMKAIGSITAHPNPVPVRDYSTEAVATLSWVSENTQSVEVHVDAPDGPLLSSTGPQGEKTTEKWVSNGMVFYLQDVSGGKPLTRENTLDRTTVYLAPARFAGDLPHLSSSGIQMRFTATGSPTRTMVAGWFSFEDGAATAGDLLARDLVCEWLERGGQPYDVALAPPFLGGIDWRTADPKNYSRIVFVCGPFANRPHSRAFLERFAGSRLVGINLSMLEPLETWNPFDLLLERDSSATARPDVCFLARRRLVPVVGVVLVEPIPAYKDRARHQAVNDAIRRLLASREMSLVEIDTRLNVNATGLRSAAEVESLIARMDAVVTTRLHGMVLALRNSVPALAIDPYAQGHKILRQAEAIGWPAVFIPDAMSDGDLDRSLDYCLSDDARGKARECAERAAKLVEEVRDRFLAEMSRG